MKNTIYGTPVPCGACHNGDNLQPGQQCEKCGREVEAFPAIPHTSGGQVTLRGQKNQNGVCYLTETDNEQARKLIRIVCGSREADKHVWDWELQGVLSALEIASILCVVIPPAKPDTIESLKEQVEQLRVQLAGCATAAQGSTKDVAKKGDYGWSPAYQDVLELRRALDGVKPKLQFEYDKAVNASHLSCASSYYKLAAQIAKELATKLGFTINTH